MKLILLTGSAVAALAMAASGAMAEQPTGFYIAGDLGINYKSDQKLKSDNDIASGFGPYQYNLSTKDANFGVLGRLGYRFNEHWRVEGELGYRPGTVDRMVGPRTYFPGDSTANRAPDSAICGVVTTTTCTGPHGHMDQTSAFANLIRDFAPDYRFHPFLGIGIGAVSANTSVHGIMSRTGQTISISGNKLQPAVQGIAGFAYALNPRTSLEVTYRLMGVNKMKYTSTVSALPAPSNNVTPNDTRARFAEAFNSSNINAPGDFSGTYSNQTVTVGLRYTFGTPPAPPPPAPMAPMMAPPPPPPATPAPPPAAPVAQAVAPSAEKVFTVYFRFDRSNLTKDAQAVVQAAADYTKQGPGPVSKVLVTGYTDTSGSAAYNMKLSERRAKSTAKALAVAGVDKSKLSLDWKGKTNLAVPTADGVKEPANRRSTIDIQF